MPVLFTSRPLAIGLLQVDVPVAHADLSAERVAVALAVNERGYALLEVLPVGMGVAEDDNETMALLEELARAHDVQALVLCGVVDTSPARQIADRVRLVVWELSPAGR